MAGPDDALLPRRFADEACASLPGLTVPSAIVSPAEVFGALQVQRLQLRHDQQVPEWALPLPVSATST